MRYSGNEPSSVILSQIKWFQKLQMVVKKCLNKMKPKRDGVIKPQNYHFKQFNTELFDALNATNEAKSTVELGYVCPRGLTGPPPVTLTK